MYHVGLDLTDDEKRDLKKLALELNQTVRSLVTRVVKREIAEHQKSK